MTIRTRWRKVLRDLWFNKTRTILVVLSISVGVFAIGVIGGSRIILLQELDESYGASSPAHATIFTLNSFDDGLVRSVRNMRAVAEAEARGDIFVRLQTGPNKWQAMQLVAVPDYNDIGIDKVRPESGAWPPPEHAMLVERSALGLTKAQVGDVVHIKTPDGMEREMPIAGLAHDLYAKVYVLDGMAYGYVTFETLEWLGRSRNYNEMRIRVAANDDDRDYIQAVADEVRTKIEKSGRSVLFTFVPNPGQHPLNYIIEAISILLGTIGGLALLLSGFLVVNTISALLAQQVRQIGMMKAIGARRSQIMSMYMVVVVLYGALTLLIAMPLGAGGAYLFTVYMADFFNFDVTNFHIPLQVLALEIGVALLVPLLAGLFPILMGTRVTVRQAISDYGLNQESFGGGLLDRWLLRVRAFGAILSRPLLLSLRNTFRRKKRLILTMVTLILAGATFITTFALYATFTRTLDVFLDYFQYDIAMQLNRPYRIERLEREAARVPGVSTIEGWGFHSTRMVRADGSYSSDVILMAPPAGTDLIAPTIGEGRWLLPGDEQTIVVNTLLLRDEPQTGVGDEITLKIEGRDTRWQIVGIIRGGQFAPMAFVNYAAFTQLTSQVGRAEWLMFTTEEHDSTFHNRVLRALENVFEENGIGVNISSVISEELAEARAIFQVVLVLLLSMTLLLAAVGGLGLMGTMSINVLERTREIGVMRAIGASDGAVRKIFLVEGILIGGVSWLVSVLLAFPLSKFISNLVGERFLNGPLEYTFSIEGVLYWLISVIVLSALATLWPARSASRLTVREVLAYE